MSTHARPVEHPRLDMVGDVLAVLTAPVVQLVELVGRHVFGVVVVNVALAFTGGVTAGFWMEGDRFAAMMSVLIGILGFAVVAAYRMGDPRPGPRPGSFCPWCCRGNVRLTVEVRGHPRPGIITLVDTKGIRVCGDCAPDVIDTALREHQFSSLPVEVLPIKRVA